MPISSITHIILRIFALNWFLTGIIQGGTMVYIYKDTTFTWFSVLPPLVYFIAGLILWIGSPWFSRLLSRENDRELSLAGVSERSLFATAFLTLGLYFALRSFADVVGWVHFFAINKSPEYGFHHEEAPSYYDLTEPTLTLFAGIGLIFTCRIWAAKLTPRRNNKKSEQGGDGDAEESV